MKLAAEANKQVVLRLARALNSGSLDQLDGILAPGYVRHDPNALFREAGRKEYKDAFSRLRSAFPDANWTLEEVLSDGDRVVGRWTFRGTHTGLFFNIKPTGRVVTYPILAIYRIHQGMIAEDWHIFHSIGMWQELIPEIRTLIESATKEPNLDGA
jgi:predicted ester cyclase